ncbi:MAG: acetate--CoA ligase family protein, partial [Candidatus Saccharicenans sp.]|nr:acetate--CoA ligase family protein [Candidatus Saccharicenans sp.]
MKNQPKIVQSILEKAESSGRNFLLEPEVYRLLGAYGMPVPRHIFWPKGKPLAASSLKRLGTDRVVVKIVSPLILHKSDVGGVVIAKANLREVRAAVNRMYAEIPARYSLVFGQGRVSAAEVAGSIQGVLVAELVSYEQAGLGSELLLGLRVSRDFGPVITFGGGGLEVEFLNAHLREGYSLAILPPAGLNRSQIIKELEAVAVFEKIAREFRGRQALVKPETLLQAIAIFQRLARDFSPFDRRLPFTLEELEVNPLVIRKGRLIPLDGLCRFSREKMEAKGRPVAQIQKLLEPKSLAIIGVSEKMNVGHIILNNVIQNGFPREKIYVVKPGLESIEGCRCFPSVAELPETVDLFILTLGAEMVYPVMKDLVELEKARSVIVIAGGLGEKSGTQSIEDDIRNLIRTRRQAGKPAPVVNGGNCLGIISAPGKYDSTFIPEYKFRKPSGLKAGLAIVSQSGAFMLSRMSKQDRFEPVYAISVGNQLDLTLGDYLTYLQDRPEARIVAVYAEGFRPGDGWRFLQAARETVRAGKQLVVYKSGRSPEGRKATASHTASVAGDYFVGRNLLRQAGAIVAETIEEFENMVKALILLEGKKIAGRRVGLMSNAGFESVIMADNLKGEDGELVLQPFSDETVGRIMKVLQPLGIDRLQDVHNPLDVTPMADDATFCGCVEALLQDSRIDCAVISCVPMTAALQTLP